MALTPEQQNRLSQLKAQRQEVQRNQFQQNTIDANLIGQLGGRLSTFEQLGIQRGQPRTGTALQRLQPDPRFMTPRQRLEELNRRKAELELLRRGKTPEQLQFVLDVNKKLETPSTAGRTAGGIAGAIATPFAFNLIPGFAALPEEVITIPMAIIKAAKTIAPIVGAGLGGGLGEMAQTRIEEGRWLRKQEFLAAFGKEAAFEAGGRAAVRSFKFAFSPFIKQTIPEAADVIQEFAKVGGVLPPTQLDRRFSLSVAEEIARGGFGGKQIFADLGEKSGRAFAVYSDQLLDRMAGGVSRLGNEQLGREFAEGITRPNGKVFQMLDDLFDPLYNQIDELTRGGVVNVITPEETTSRILKATGEPFTGTTFRAIPERPLAATVRTDEIISFAKKQLAIDDRLKGLFLSPTGRTLFEKAKTLPKKLSFGDIRKLRSSFMRSTRKLARDVDESQGMIKQISKITNDVVRDPASASGLTPEARKLWENTSRLYEVAQTGLKETFPEQLGQRLSKNPSSVTKELFQNSKAIRNLRRSLIEPISGRPSKEGTRQWLQLRTAWFADAVENATRGDIIKPTLFESSLRRMGKAAIKEMIPDAEGKKQLQTIRNLLKAMSKKPEGGASLFIRGGQVGGLFMIYNGTKEGDWLQVSTGGALVSGPFFFAKMAKHPLGSRLIASGIKLKPGSTSLVPITARLVNLARQIDRKALQAQLVKQRRKTPRPTRPFVAPRLP